MQVQQADNHQPKHGAAPSSTATGRTVNGEMECEVREGIEEQMYLEELEATVMVFGSRV